MTDTAFLNFFDVLTRKEDWREIPDYPGCMITSDGRVLGQKKKLMKRYLNIVDSVEDDYDKIVSSVVFRDGEEWGDIPGTRNQVHRRGAVRNVATGTPVNISVKIDSGPLVSVH